MTQKKDRAKIAQSKSETKNTTPVVKLPTLDELRKENEEMKKKLSELMKLVENRPKDIEEQIKYFEKKKERINHLRKFEVTKENLAEFRDTLESNKNDEIFSNENYKLVFGSISHYSNEIQKVLVSISNTDLLLDFVVNLQKAVDVKIDELKKEISL